MANFFSRIVRIFQSPDRYERVRTFETLYVDYRDPATGNTGSGEGLDICPQSIRFASFGVFKKNAPLELNLRFSYKYTETRTLTLKGNVIECKRLRKQRRHRTVCVFEQPLLPEDQAEIRNLIAWLGEVKEKYLFFRYGKGPG